MDTATAIANGIANRGKEPMVFDWDLAARMIRESGCVTASAGLRSDWGWTGGCIYRDGKPVMDDYTYLSSTWAVPEIEIDGVVHPCYRMESECPGWSSDTKWPGSAVAILSDEEAPRD